MFRHIYHTRIVWILCALGFVAIVIYVYLTQKLSLNECGTILLLAIIGYLAWQRGKWLKEVDDALNGEVRRLGTAFHERYPYDQPAAKTKVETGGGSGDVYIDVARWMSVLYNTKDERLEATGWRYTYNPISRWHAWEAIKQLKRYVD